MRIAVISGKGGSGKSSVTSALISLSESVVVVDCDVDASNLPLLFHYEPLRHEGFASGTELIVDDSVCIGCGTCSANCAFGALSQSADGRIKVEEVLCEGCGLCQRLCPIGAISLGNPADSDIYVSRFPKGLLVHGNLAPGDDNSGKMVTRLREIADEAMEEGTYAMQILDGPPGIGCPVLSTVTGMDKILIVTEPTLSGISDLKRAYTIAQNYCDEIMVIINKYDINLDNTLSISKFCEENGLPVIARLPFDRRMVESQVNCQSIVDYAPSSVCAEEIRKAYQSMVTSSMKNQEG